MKGVPYAALLVLLHLSVAWGGIMVEKTVKKLKTSSGRPWEDEFRLPNSTHPDHYDLYLHPDLVTKTFSGRVTIHVTSSETRDHFLVHTKWLNVSQTKVVKVVEGETTEDVNIIDAFEYEPNEFWVIRTSVVEPGTYQISMSFSGSLKTGIVGFYYSDYTDEEGVQRGLATTKFEPTYARRAFPCFDEPTFKSSYTITIVRPSERYIALSNMPVKNEVAGQPSESLTEVTFEKSVPMVTYLVCFIVCDFTYKETTMSSGMPFRVYAPKGRIENSQYALDTGAKILQMYEGMFDLPFPLPKSDMAAIPDYSSGATEHWGIITFRETSIFYNQNQSSAVNKQRVASVVAHELAHQWFGNLVTLEWWNDLWLNEGFASYVEFKGVDHVHPEWEMESQFPISNLQPVFVDDAKLSSHSIVQTVENPDEINAMFDSISYDKDSQFLGRSLQLVMNIDSRLSSHPIVKNVNTPDQINAMFDAISYRKGSSVLRMLEDFMGDSFQAGINAFLKKYAYANAVTKDLWTELTLAWEGNHPEGEKGDVGAIMDTWTRQMGYPVVNVVRSAPDSFTLTQERFLQDPTAEYDPSESEFGYRWDIPIGYITSHSSLKKTWHYLEQESLEIKVDTEVSWLKLNVNQKGYYRVNYEPAMWDQLADLCAEQVLQPPDRASLYDDALALADAELLDYPVALNLTRSLAFETDYVPWNAASGHLIDIGRLLSETIVYQPFSDYVLTLVEPVYSSLGWADTGDHLQKLLRTDVVTIACISGSNGCLQEAATELQSWISDATYPLPLGTKRQVYRWGVVQGGTQEMWETMWQRALTETSATETDNLYFGMANFQDTGILERFIELSQDENNVRSQNFLHILQYIAVNSAGSDLVWNWVRANWEWLVDRYTLNDRYLGQLIPNISKYFSTPRKLSEMEEFFAKYPEAGAGELNRQQALETVRSNIRWVDAYANTILDWLNSQKQ